jgi:hypothetical protein
MTFKEPEDEEFERIEREQAMKHHETENISFTVPASALAVFKLSTTDQPKRLTKAEVLHIWTTLYPPYSQLNPDTFVYEFANALQTYLGIGE